jgi:predicted SAM-dependent methyltransferase
MKDRHKYGSRFYNLSLKNFFKQELLSFFGRLFSSNKIKTKKKYLQLGCGDVINNESFLNCDFYDIDFFWPFNKKKIYQLDLRYSLPFDDCQFKGVFSEHVIEHLYPSESQKLFMEVYRVLKKDGIFRVIVPDLKKYIKLYNSSGKKILGNKKFDYGCELLWDLTNNYGHKTIWDADWLVAKLLEAGFQECKEVSYKNGGMINLILDKEGREHESLYVEAKKL